MKKINITLLLVVLSSGLFYSFVLKSATLSNSQNYPVRYNTSLPTGFINIFGASISEMNPASYVSNAPTLSNGGEHTGFNSTPFQNNICEVGYGNSSNPNRGGGTDDYVSSGTYTEFDILMTSNFAFTWGNGFGGTVDRETGLKHELGHGVGLDHTGVSSRLMFASYTVNQTKSIGQDERRGYDCIYNNVCTGQEGGSGNLEFSTDMRNNNGLKILTWSVETDSPTILGFNVYEKLANGNLRSVNTKMIKFVSDRDDYSYEINKNEQRTYYVEVVGENNTDMRMFKF